MGERHKDTSTTQPQSERLFMVDQKNVGHEVAALQLADLQQIDGEVYLETESGNTYLIYKTPDGKLAMVDSRSNQGKGNAMCGSYFNEDDINSGVLTVKKPFVYKGGSKTSAISRITFINKDEKPLAKNQGQITTSNVRNRFRESLDLVAGKKMDYEAIGKGFAIDENNPSTPESILPPMGGNFFENEDDPTLAGKVIAKVYTELIRRENQPQKERTAEEATRVVEKCRAELKAFFYYTKIH